LALEPRYSRGNYRICPYRSREAFQPGRVAEDEILYWQFTG
jgi:hypothetical protein